MPPQPASIRRLLQEASELSQEIDLIAEPLENDLFQWHFTIKGPGEEYTGGIYHGRLVLPSNYPFSPPEIFLLTPSGRFEVNKKICLSISSFHPESWQPSWGIRTALVALSAFFSTDPKGAVGSLDVSPVERQRLAKASQTFKCHTCGFDGSTCSLLEQDQETSNPAKKLDTPPKTEEESNSPPTESRADAPDTIAPLFRSPARHLGPIEDLSTMPLLNHTPQMSNNTPLDQPIQPIFNQQPIPQIRVNLERGGTLHPSRVLEQYSDLQEPERQSILSGLIDLIARPSVQTIDRAILGLILLLVGIVVQKIA